MARWKAAAELACVRWAQRIEQLLALASWRLEGYRQAAEWVGLRMTGAGVPQGREGQQQHGAPGGGRRDGPKPM